MGGKKREQERVIVKLQHLTTKCVHRIWSVDCLFIANLSVQYQISSYPCKSSVKVQCLLLTGGAPVNNNTSVDAKHHGASLSES